MPCSEDEAHAAGTEEPIDSVPPSDYLTDLDGWMGHVKLHPMVRFTFSVSKAELGFGAAKVSW